MSEYSYDAAGKRSNFKPGFYVGVVPAVEFDDAYDGDGLASKQLDTRRGYDLETGQIYTISTTSYYLRSTMLGGQVIAELDAQGNKTSSYIYGGGMQLAKETIASWLPSGAVVHWQYTDPVTGSNGMSGMAREYTGTTELDTFGSDVTYPPPPPDPETFELPIYAGPVGQTYYAIEGGPSEGYGVSSSYLQAVQNSIDRGLAEHFFSQKKFDVVKEILERNPNVGVFAKQTTDFVTVSTTRWGQEAADFIVGIGREIFAGSLIPVADEKKYSVNVSYTLNSPQNPQGPFGGPVGSKAQYDPCANARASDLNFLKLRRRGTDKNGNGIYQNGMTT